MTMIIAAAIFIIAVIGLIVMMQKKKKEDTKSVDNAPDTPGQQPENSLGHEVKTIMDSLLKLNVLIRKDRDFSSEMRETIEDVIDDLTLITPAMIQRYPGESLTYELKKIGKEHLYKTVKEFLDLSLASRINQSAIFEKTIKNLHEVSNRARDIVEKNETAEFKTMANFLAGKFAQ
jgi:hypothetical protein